MSPFFAEFLGTMFLIVFGNGVVANVCLSKSIGHNAGWIVITVGWAMAVFVGVYVASHGSGAHLNPAVTFALAAFSDFSWADVPVYLGAQMLGAMIGQALVWLCYYKHYDETTEPPSILATFSTGPAIASPPFNFLSETVATFVFVLAILFLAKPDSSLGSFDALPVALVVLAIGLSLGGPTGYAINPARDFGPRIMHALLPIKNKGGSHWEYSWIPIFGPIVGGLLAGLFFKLFIDLGAAEIPIPPVG